MKLKKKQIRFITKVVNQKLKETFENEKHDKAIMIWKYPYGVSRQLNKEMIKNYLKDKAYPHNRTDVQDVIEEIFNLANDTPAELNPAEKKIIHVSNETIFIAIDKTQTKAILAKEFMNKSCDKCYIGNYFTPDEKIIEKINELNLKEKIVHIRNLICLTKGFKKDIGAILTLKVDDIGIDVEVSKIGGQFDFTDMKYYNASKTIQYYIHGNLDEKIDKKSHLFIKDLKIIEP